MNKTMTILILFGFDLFTGVLLALPAFPGAEGFGAQTPGGRAGRVVEVTNLNDSGPGSLRQALEVEAGPRTVVFRTGGTIALNSRIKMAGEADSFVTVAGQTAPGDGIQLKNWGVQIRDGAHDIVIRHLRIRPGNGSGAFTTDIDPLEIWGSGGSHVYNIVVDHVSLEWAMDENSSAYAWATDITYQWCSLAEALLDGQNHAPAKGFLASGGPPHPDNLTFHHNLFAHNPDRSPKIEFAAADLVNNVIYNWGGNNNSKFGLGARINLVNNVYLKGPDSFAAFNDIAWVVDNARLYVSGNWGPKCPAGCAADWAVGFREEISPYPLADESRYRAAARFPAPSVTTAPAAAVLELVLNNAGATLPMRDSLDARIIASVSNRTGRTGASSGYPVLRAGIPPPDTDHDGMPDSWEVSHHLDLNNPADRNGTNLDGNGYTNLEVYLNSMGSVAADEAPSVSITTPTNGAKFIALAKIKIEAVASDRDGAVGKVEFFAGTKLVGEVSVEPFRLSWVDVPAGDYSLTARATDQQGATTTSAAVNISVAAAWQTVEQVAGGWLRLMLAGESNREYALEISEDLAQWTQSETQRADPTGTVIFTEFGAMPSASRFYRARRLP